ncbi:MAG: outer membrane protein assembly factor BamE [Alphaproteobacteria bacterium]|nr:outer membrane protein assembly factor BamE [Alphaproteobacteria bacterium]
MSINKIALVCFCTVLLVSCSTAKQNEWFVSHNGNMPAEERVSQIKEGATKDEVLLTLGVPSSTASFDENTWIYMSSDIKRVAFMAPKEVKRDILKISFNSNDQVKTIEHLTLADGKKIEPSSDKTPVNGERTGFFRKYFGGVGQYNPFGGSGNGGL